MEYRQLGSTNVKISVLGQGTYRIDDRGRENAVKVLRRGIELGMTVIDTAEMYGWGSSERIVGEAIREFDREDLFIITKVWYTNLRYNDVLRSAKASLERLDSGYIDLYLIHWPNPSISLRETMKAMEKLVDEGIVRFIGVSNFSTSLIEEAMGFLSRSDIVANEVEYNLLERRIEDDILPYCQREKITIIAYSPLAKGLLAVSPPKTLVEVANKYGKTPAQTALNWLICKPGVVAIPKTSSIPHVEENSGAVGWRLAPEDQKILEML